MGETVEFTSRMSRGETLAAIVYMPVHILLLPVLGTMAYAQGLLSAADVNLLVYAVGAVYMLLLERRFLRRDFDALCDKFLNCLIQICICYGLMLLMNLILGILIGGLLPGENPNNVNIMTLAQEEYGKIAAMAIFLAPISEELMFRGAVFGALRGRGRGLAYTVSILLFSVYHVWGYVSTDPLSWLYVLQYMPVSYLLCRCYERTNSIWSSIFLHMLINGISIRALLLLEELL